MSRLLIVAVCAGIAVDGPRLQAQWLPPTGPTSALEGPPAPATRAFDEAWLRVITGGEPRRSRALPFTATIETVIQSDRGERILWSTQITTRTNSAGRGAEAKLRVPSLPTLVPFVLRISTRDRHGVTADVYTETRRLQFPDESQVTRLGFGPALEQAGFLGNFVISQADGTVRRREK